MSTDPKSTSPKAANQRPSAGWWRDMPRWKKVLVGTALLATVAGGVMMLFDTGGAGGTGGGAGGGGAGALGAGGGNLLPGQPRSGLPSAATAGEEASSRGIFRLGFSFIAGFCLGTFVRSTLKLAAIAVGFWLFLTFVLSYYGLVHVDWQAIDGLWSRFAGNVEQEWGNFQRFITGSLPAAGLAGLGIFAGLKRR